MRMSNLIPITKIYDIYPKYTFSKDVMRFMDDIVGISRAEVFTKDEVMAMLAEIQLEIEECVDGGEGSPQFEQGVDIARCQVVDIIQEKINALGGKTDVSNEKQNEK